MSYNISSWKTNKLENLIIPLKSLYIHEREDWHPEKPKIENMETGEVSIECASGQKIEAILKDGNLHITKFEFYDECSGPLMDYIIKPALLQSTGELNATLIWEGGNDITSLSVINGELKEENIGNLLYEKATEGNKKNDRFIILEESLSGHCCFEYTVVDTHGDDKVCESSGIKGKTMCECFEKENAEIICNALNQLP